ncbi:hypothetical protein ZIOFF_037739 [Zingiber officinale]|uniref:HhH-GPD domain-containing protein n=1 Tax=Zingiber officinale TaxID=94328 RepID=A0A8J5GC25_ZINOF|nr:hypothetical protein ZIOFF_037739 [Zingiber officinale]
MHSSVILFRLAPAVLPLSPRAQTIRMPPTRCSARSLLSNVIRLHSELKPEEHSTSPSAFQSKRSNASKVNAPENWKEVLNGIKTMTLAEGVTFRTMGCESEEKPLPSKVLWKKDLESWYLAFCRAKLKEQLPVACSVVPCAVARLSEKGLLDAAIILKTEESVIASLIKPVAFYSRKAHYMKEVAEICSRKYGGDIPSSVNELLALPGVGSKIAHLVQVMIVGWNNVQGICVDTHVHRICNRLGWVSRPGTGLKTSTPEETRVLLEKWLPKDLWDPINPLLIGFGRSICTAPRPRCGICSVNNLCPSAFKEVTKSSKSKAKRSIY